MPWELRLLCPRRPEVMTALARSFWRALGTELVRRSGDPDAEAGTVTFIQDFGGSLNLDVHLHVADAVIAATAADRRSLLNRPGEATRATLRASPGAR